MANNYVTLTGNLGATAANAKAIFTPSNWLTDALDNLLLPPTPVDVEMDGAGKFSVSLLATDNSALPSGWTWKVQIFTPGATSSFSFFLPFSGGATQDIADIAPVETPPSVGTWLPLAGGVMNGPLTLQGDPASALQAATKQYVDNHLLATVPTLVATTGMSGFNLAATSGDIITWTAPNDGNMHRVMTIVEMHTTSALTGGQITAPHTAPDGGTYSAQLIAANSTLGFHNISNPVYLVAPGGTFAVHQGSGVSAGAAVLWAEIWAL